MCNGLKVVFCSLGEKGDGAVKYLQDHEMKRARDLQWDILAIEICCTEKTEDLPGDFAAFCYRHRLQGERRMLQGELDALCGVARLVGKSKHGLLGRKRPRRPGEWGRRKGNARY